MEAKLNSETINYLKKILDTSFTHEETAETIVPDSMPDIGEIMDTAGVVTLRSKEADGGRVSLTGTIAATVIYCPAEENIVHKLELNIPFAAGLDAEGVSEDSRLNVAIRLGSIDSRTINSRKVLVRADLIVEIMAFESASISYSHDIEDSQSAGIQLLRERARVTLVTQAREKTFVLADEFTMPAGRPEVRELLKSEVRLNSEDVKAVGNKLIFKGTALIHILYKSDAEPEPIPVDFTASFSQIMEMDMEDEEQEQDVRLMLTSFYVEHGNTVVSENSIFAVEMHIVAQAVARKKIELQYISDIYSTVYGLSEMWETLAVDSEERAFTVPVEQRSSIELPMAEPVHRIIDVSAACGKVHFTTDKEEAGLKTNVMVSIIYSAEDGRMSGLTKRIEVTGSLDHSPEMISGASANIVGNVHASPADGGIDVDIPVQFELRPYTKFKAVAVSGAEWDEDNPKDLSMLPSVVIYHAKGGEDFWHMAKNFASTETLIRTANSLEEGAAPSPGQFFIIPKRR